MAKNDLFFKFFQLPIIDIHISWNFSEVSMGKFFSNKKHIVRYRNKDVLIHKFDKIMFLSCVRISRNRYELTFLLDYIFSLNDTKTIIPIKAMISAEEYQRISKMKFGVWLRFNNNYFRQNYIYIYRNLNSNRLIFKTTRHDNYLNNGKKNQYNHELIFKGALQDKAILEYLG